MITVGRVMIVLVGIAIAINIGGFMYRLPIERLAIYLVGMAGVGAFVGGVLWHARNRL